MFLMVVMVQGGGTARTIAYDKMSGEVVWATNEMGWGTCLWVEGYLLCCDIKGNLYLMKPGAEKFELVTEMAESLGKVRGRVWTIPVAANGRLYLRFKQKLVCYELAKGG